MMAPLRFRAWDKKTSKMDTDGEYRLGRFFDIHDTAGSDSIIMQSTGLHDKNGKEIFCGDVLKHSPHWSDDSTQSVVEWAEACAYFYPFGNSDYAINAFDCEVIGDIYSNPELLSNPKP